MSRGWGAVQNDMLERCWARAEAHPDDPDAWWITLDQVAGTRTRAAALRESYRRAISRLSAEGELERGWLQGWPQHVYAAPADLPDPRSMDRLLCCRVPPALVTYRHALADANRSANT